MANKFENPSLNEDLDTNNNISVENIISNSIKFDSEYYKDKAEIIEKINAELSVIKESAIKNHRLIYGQSGAFIEARTSDGKKSNLNEHEWLITQTENFKSWFQGSIMIDENGEPLVLFHGANENDHKAIVENGFKPKTYSNNSSLEAVFFSDYYGQYLREGRRSYPVFLNLKKIKVLPSVGYKIGETELKRLAQENEDGLVQIGANAGGNQLISKEELDNAIDKKLDKWEKYILTHSSLNSRDALTKFFEDDDDEKKLTEFCQKLIDKNGIGGLPIQELAVFDNQNIKSIYNLNFEKNDPSPFH